MSFVKVFCMFRSTVELKWLSILVFGYVWPYNGNKDFENTKTKNKKKTKTKNKKQKVKVINHNLNIMTSKAPI